MQQLPAAMLVVSSSVTYLHHWRINGDDGFPPSFVEHSPSEYSVVHCSQPEEETAYLVTSLLGAFSHSLS